MNKFDHLETLAQRLIEGPFNRLFQTRLLHPADLAQRLMQAMLNGIQDNAEAGANAVPNEYEVMLNPADYTRLIGKSSRSQLIAAIRRDLDSFIHEGDYQLVGPLHISLDENESVSPGQIEIKVNYVSSIPGLPSEETYGSPLTGPDEIDTLAANSAVNWRLQIGDHQFTLGEPVVRIGRAFDNDIVLDDSSIASYHAQLRWRAGRYYLYPPTLIIRRQANTRGPSSKFAKTTSPNGPDAIVQRPLAPGEVIKLGQVTLTVIVETDEG